MHEKMFAYMYLFTLVQYSLQIPVAIQFAPNQIPQKVKYSIKMQTKAV